jgi:hypothetical protein
MERSRLGHSEVAAVRCDSGRPNRGSNEYRTRDGTSEVRGDDMRGSHAGGFRSAPAAESNRDLLLPTGSPVEERLSNLDVACHSDTFVTLERLCEQRLRLFVIPWCGAIN